MNNDDGFFITIDLLDAYVSTFVDKDFESRPWFYTPFPHIKSPIRSYRAIQVAI